MRKRQTEFLAGRWCARQALRVCVPESGDIEIAIGHNREPLWPAMVVGAITHADGFASADALRREIAQLYPKQLAAGYRAFRIAFEVLPPEEQRKQ